MKRIIQLNEHGRRINEDHHNAKLTDFEVEMIHQLREGGMTYREIAHKFEVSYTLVGKIIRFEHRGQIALRFKRVDV